MPETYHDVLWGEIDLHEPLLSELVESRPMQRLKHIHQAGASYYLFPGLRPITRFEHSLGVMHLLTCLGASLDERVAGLLHDVPHTAFSHTVDIVFPNSEHNFHERFQEQIILNSEIPAILSRHDVTLDAALHPHNYPLLEASLPDLSADRIDYALRDMCMLGKLSTKEAIAFVGHLVPTVEGLVVNNLGAALQFSLLFAEANDTLYTNVQEAGAYWALAGAIREAYRIGAFTDDDLFSTDDDAMSKLLSISSPVVQAYLKLLTPGTDFCRAGPDQALYFTTTMKNRVIDPPVREAGWPLPRRLTSISTEYRLRVAGIPVGSSTADYNLWSEAIDPLLFSEAGVHKA
ncbi:MAG: HD domain-containing protein [Chloroflexota bacterium]|nr:HD domain-containing protein [Chloroflexota bacterium]